MTDEQVFHERRHTDHDGTTTARLERIERKLDELVKQQEAQARSIRSLEDWRIEMGVYLKQARWTLIVAAGALIAGTINTLIVLVTHP